MSLALNKSALNWSWRSFDQLSKSELYEILSFRQSIFVVEQKSWYQDADGLDEESEHLLVTRGNRLVAYLRLLPAGKRYETPSIGRISVHKDMRRDNIGSDLIVEGLKKCKEIYSSNSTTISAQEYLINFYEGHGFEVIGDVYDEDGIPHVEMIRNG